MAYSNNLRLELITTGTQAGTWGDTTNTNLGTLLEGAISGYETVSVTTANQALTANNGAADQSRLAMLRLTTVTGAAFTLYAPPASKQYIIYNDSGYTATLSNATIANGTTPSGGATITVSNGEKAVVFSDGTNFYKTSVVTSFSAGTTGLTPSTATTGAITLAGTLAVANGGTGGTTQATARSGIGAAASGANSDITSITGLTTALSVAQGGTGQTTYTNGQLLIGNTTGNTLTKATLTAGSGISITNGTGSITIAATGTGGATIPSGTSMLFIQTSAPTGWTKDTTHNNKALRIVSGAASSGGSVAFTTAFASQTPTGTVSGTVGSTTLSTTQMPAHTHGPADPTFDFQNYKAGGGSGAIIAGSDSYNLFATTGSAGGGSSHNHSFSGSFSGSAINLAVQYVDAIIATAN